LLYSSLWRTLRDYGLRFAYSLDGALS